MDNVTSKALVTEVCKALADKRGKDIVAMYVREKTDLCDYFVIASGTNAPQIRAMGERVEELVEKNLGLVPSRTEGVRDGRWAVTAVPTLDEKEWGSSVSFPSLVPTSQPTLPLF